MFRLAFCNEKGGGSKTTLSLNAAHCLALAGRRVLLVDGDPQGTATDWLGVRGGDAPAPFRVVGLARAVIHKEIGELARGYDAVIIDCPPKNEDVMRSAIAAASHVVVPIQPSGADLWPTRRLVDVIGQARVFKEDLKAAYCVTRLIEHTAIGRELRVEAEAYGLPVMAAAMAQRVVYARALSVGQTVFEWQGETTSQRRAANQAREEITAIVAEVEGL
jgi:chromosome partitioning protein